MDLPTTAPELSAAAAALPEPAPSPRPTPRRRPLFRSFIQLLRRGHLYAGLLMLPWVILYGVTAFLFNHPGTFSDQPGTEFGRAALAGTPMENPPAPAELAGQVVAALQGRTKDAKYTLIQPENAKYARESVFATVKGDGREVSVLIDVAGNGGTVRSRTQPQPQAKPEEVAPFAIAGRPVAGGQGGFGGRGAGGPKGGERGGGGGPKGGERGGAKGGERGEPRGGEGLKLDNPLHERVLASVPVVLEKTGFPVGEVTVTSVPDLTFLMDADGKVWRVGYNAQTGAVTGRSADEPAGDSLSPRRFLTRLHTAHGYPGEVNAKWLWAVVVDAMAGIMVFWGLSGVLMWWQIKSTRWVGLLVLVVSGAAAWWVGSGMHELMASTAGR